MTTSTQPQQNPKRKSFVFFIVGSVFLLMMGFFWALDSAIVNVALGIAVFFFFLGFWYYPWKTIRHTFSKKQPYGNQHKQQRKQTGFSFEEITKEFSEKINQETSHTPSQSPNPFLARRKSIQIMVIGLFVVFFMFILMVIFASGDDPEADTQYYFSMAENFRDADQFDSARIYYIRAVKADPENLDAWNNYGLLFMNKQRYDTAFKIFEHIQMLDNSYEYSRYNKALIHYWQKNYRKSLSEDLALISINPYYNEALQLAGDNYYEQQRYDSALVWYQQAYDNGLRNAWLCHVMAYLYDTKGETDKAVPLYREAVEMAPNKVDVFARLGELLSGAEGEEYRMKAAQLKKEGY